ncbi:hypothetical protein PoB_006563900 [Plakobranchus ocellatus]|uniref:Uncharacterized protein n=1 Tax=Plakobranchus ocellatus TaxID=259542 RepID=A0AAV4D4T5_9GAST|nr:hypothetical protein PoB_006563900 [Plakobranchus ocellatus]
MREAAVMAMVVKSSRCSVAELARQQWMTKKFGDELSTGQRHELEELADFLSSLNVLSNRPSSTSLKEHRIELTSSTLLRQCPHPVPYAMKQTLCNELDERGSCGIISKNNAAHISLVIV